MTEGVFAKACILACDTTQGACSVAVGTHTQLRPMTRGHAEALPLMVADVLAEARLDFAALDALAVTLGPGTFTGVRVGLAAAHAYALALDIPLIGVSTLAAMAAPALDGNAPILVAVDARRATYYCQFFDAQGAPLSAPQALSAAQIIAEAGAQSWRLVGTGAPLLAEALPACTIADAPDWPQAAYVAELARAMDMPHDLPEPIYLRPPDATLPDPSKALRKQMG